MKVISPMIKYPAIAVIILCSLVIIQGCADTALTGVTVQSLRCEYMENPLGIDATKPRLSWILESDVRGQKQTAYQIIVSSSRDLCGQGTGDRWDSGKVDSAQSVNIVYDGTPLASRMDCWWRVRVWDMNGDPSGWSEPARWSMGLLDPAEWRAEFIGGDWDGDPYPAFPLMRKTVELAEKPAHAMAYVCPLGYYELYINGEKVDDHVLSPAVSDYSKRYLYVTHDVTGYLREGTNTIALWLGRGWYVKGNPGVIHTGPLVKAVVEIAGADGAETVIGTDASWKIHPSHITPLGESLPFGDYGGEQYDARLEILGWNAVDYDDSAWEPAVVFDPPEALVASQMVEPNRIVDTIKPASIETLDDGAFLVDMGKNFAGWLSIRFPGQLEPGQSIRLDYADFIGRNGRLSIHNQRDIYLASGTQNESFRSRFNYHAFQWVRIEGLERIPAIEDIEGYMIHTDYDLASEFACSNSLLTDIYNTTVWTYRCLTLGGYIVDCPTRERLGYGGDAGTSLETGMFNFGVAGLYTRWLSNWRDAQAPDGDLPYTAPAYKDVGGGGPMWSGICITLPWQIYLHYGDTRVLDVNYHTMQQWLAFVKTKEKDGILEPYISYGISMPQWNFLGDWVAPRGDNVSREGGRPDEHSTLFFNNCYYLYVLDIAASIADKLGKPDDAKMYATRAGELRATLHERFFNSDTKTYANGEQPYLAFPLLLDMVPGADREAVMKNLEDAIVVTRDGHLNAGMHGIYFLLKLLMEENRNDLIFMMANQTTHPSWGYMLEQGATTIWESWTGGSHIHDTLISIGSWFIQGVGGIKPDKQTPGFKHFIIDPQPVGDLTWADTCYRSLYGDIRSEWRVENGGFSLDVEVPQNTTADVYVPASSPSSVRESGKSAAGADGVELLREENGRVVYRVQSGSYSFVVAE